MLFNHISVHLLYHLTNFHEPHRCFFAHRGPEALSSDGRWWAIHGNGYPFMRSFMDFHGFSWIFFDFHGFWSTLHGNWWIWINFGTLTSCRFSSILDVFFLDHSATFYNANCGTWYVENSVDTSLDLDPSNFAQLWGDFLGMRHSLAIFLQYHTWVFWFLDDSESAENTWGLLSIWQWGLPFVNIGRTWSIYEVFGVEKAPTIGWFHSCWACHKSLPHGWWENLWNLRQQPKKWSPHALMNYKVSLTLTQCCCGS